MSVRAVLFDYTGVFTTFPLVDLDPDLLRLFWGDYGDVDENHPWHQLERGEIALGEFMAGLAERARAAHGPDFDVSVFLGALREGFAVHWPVVHRARELKRSYRLALLTNNVREFGDAWRGTIPVAELFDVVVDSCEVGTRKPEARYYRAALDMLGVEPEEAVFLDDMAANVEGARAAGITSIHVSDPAAAMATLDAVLSSSGSATAP